MTLLWTTPRDWAAKDPITKERLNAISNDLTYLYNPPLQVATIRGSAVDVNITGTTPTAIDDANLGVSIELSGRAVMVRFHLTLSNGTLGNYNMLDIVMDGTTYLSSMSGTPLTNGLWRQRQFVAAYQQTAEVNIIIPEGVLTAGVHTFYPRAFVSAGTLTAYLSAGYFAQFSVGE